MTTSNESLARMFEMLIERLDRIEERLDRIEEKNATIDDLKKYHDEANSFLKTELERRLPRLPDLSLLQGRRVVMSREMPADEIFNPETLIRMSGGIIFDSPRGAGFQRMDKCNNFLHG